MNTDALKEYLRHVYELELSLYKQRMLQNSVRAKLKECSNVSYVVEEKCYGEEKSRLGILFTAMFSGITLGLGIGFMIWCLWGIWNFFEFLSSWSFSVFTFFSFSSFIKVSIIPMIIVFFLAFSSETKEADRIEIEHINVKRRNDENREKNKRLQESNRKKVLLLKEMLQSQAEYYKKTYNTLQMYYEKNVIFPKYRNFVAVTSFYEYFCSGRCSQLTGHEGAYNIFESELRQNMIIAKLDEVITRLEAIEENQYMLYTAIKESNKKMNKISGDISNAVNKLERIEDNSSVMAYNSEITAQNTEYMKWLMYFQA